MDFSKPFSVGDGQIDPTVAPASDPVKRHMSNQLQGKEPLTGASDGFAPDNPGIVKYMSDLLMGRPQGAPDNRTMQERAADPFLNQEGNFYTQKPQFAQEPGPGYQWGVGPAGIAEGSIAYQPPAGMSVSEPGGIPPQVNTSVEPGPQDLEITIKKTTPHADNPAEQGPVSGTKSPPNSGPSPQQTAPSGPRKEMASILKGGSTNSGPTAVDPYQQGMKNAMEPFDFAGAIRTGLGGAIL